MLVQCLPFIPTKVRDHTECSEVFGSVRERECPRLFGMFRTVREYSGGVFGERSGGNDSRKDHCKCFTSAPNLRTASERKLLAGGWKR